VGKVLLFKKLLYSGNIETVFKGQFTNGNYTIPCQNTNFKIKTFGLSLTIGPKKPLIFGKQLKVSNHIPYPYPARIFEQKI
jgi:hypothetical protein